MRFRRRGCGRERPSRWRPERHRQPQCTLGVRAFSCRRLRLAPSARTWCPGRHGFDRSGAGVLLLCPSRGRRERTRQLRPDRSEREPMVAHRSNRWRRVGRDWLVARRPRAVDGGYCCRSRSARPRARGTNALGDHAGLPSRDLRAESGRLERGDSLWLCVGNRLPRPTGSVSLTQRSKQPRRPASRIGFRSAQPSPAPTVPRSWTSEHISLPGRPTP